MIYEDVKIFSHPRSGTNYLGALVQLNFFEESNFSQRFDSNAHRMSKNAERFIINNPNTGIIYIYRSFNDVINSVFNARKILGLNVESVGQLLNSKYSEVWSKSPVEDYTMKSFKDLNAPTKYKKKVSGHFSKVNMYPEEYWKEHINSWLKLSLKYNNILMLGYEDLKNQFYTTMKSISTFLGVDKENFEDVKEKVGIIPKN